MTDEEAIEALTSKEVVNPYLTLEALEIAIEALKEKARIKAQKKFEFEMTPEEAIEELQNVLNGEIAEYGEEGCEYTEKAFEMAFDALRERKTTQDATEAAETPEFEEGELIVYQNGETFQIGEIKRLCEEGAFVWYHEGDTASLTPFENMHKLRNAYCIKQTSFALDRNAEE